MTLRTLDLRVFFMAINLQFDIIKFLNDLNISQENQVQCRFHFLNAMLTTGRLLTPIRPHFI
jgi:hypothetical protein